MNLYDECPSELIDNQDREYLEKCRQALPLFAWELWVEEIDDLDPEMEEHVDAFSQGTATLYGHEFTLTTMDRGFFVALEIQCGDKEWSYEYGSDRECLEFLQEIEKRPRLLVEEMQAA